ncbi:MAG: S1C family serine protease [bacterium]|nr:S1C family serine protease [bacterium]
MLKKIIRILLIIIIYFAYKLINKSYIEDIYDYSVYIEAIDGDSINIGSGFVYDKKNGKNYIVTCYHIIDGAKNIKVYNYNEKYEIANLIKYDLKSDLALLEIDDNLNLKKAKLGSSNNIALRDNVYVVGTPLNKNYIISLTSGIISNVKRSLKVNGNTYNAIQFDAEVSGGNSGGALLNGKGKVIGMVFLKEENASNISFAIPIDDIKRNLKNKESNYELKR